MRYTLIVNIIIISILILSNANSFAQKDTTTFRISTIRESKHIDSLLNDNRATQLQPVLVTNFNQKILLPENNLTSIHFETTPKKKNIFNAPYSRFIIPATFITYGAITREIGLLKQLDVRTNIEVCEHFNKEMPIDNFLQFAPIIAVYGLDLTGIAKAKHNFRDRIIISTTSYLIMGATVESMKNSIAIKRPDYTSDKSFPSGHTATAFVGAHILFKEYKDTSPWIGMAGYTAATATGIFRVLNKRHWVSDVVCGAGIGILSAEAGYMLLPVFHNIFGISRSNKNLVVAPIAGLENYGIGLAYIF